MIIGEEKILETAQKVLDRINETNDSDDLVEIDEVFIIVAVHYGADEVEEDAEVGELYYRCTSARQHVQFGLLFQATRAVEGVIGEANE
jgi:hypothetical protein